MQPKGYSVSTEELFALLPLAQQLTLKANRFTTMQTTPGKSPVIQSRGMDFAETRHYLPGDDIRSIDWRATARTFRPHTKRYSEECEQTIFFLIDLRPSMFFGSRQMYKSVLAIKAATILALSCAKQHLSVGFILLHGTQFIRLPTQHNLRQLMTLLPHLAKYSEQIPTDGMHLTNLLTALTPQVAIGSPLFFFSDFFDMTSKTQPAWQALLKRYEFNAGFLFDPLERQLPVAEIYTITNGQDFLTINTSNNQLRTDFQTLFLARQQAVLKLCHETGNRFFTLSTAEPLKQTITRAWNKSI